ncbi:MAG TPA: LysM peptidoglycan-binding domain-containing protein, partial [Acidobacteriota bacterium]|nr:LysM peptidoglycan-binding domain-containing protein [Acidobacteriota bacterium]
AAGPWQFISSTGRKYGLHASWWLDERRDFEKSTHAACRYLKDLYGMFDAWTLALAAYNGGEGRVGRQIRRQNTRDFWELRLHQQTRNYVPLFMAALSIAKEPERYGFYIEPDPPLEFEWAATNKALELKDVARAIGCSTDALVELNPELRRLVTPPDVEPYRFRVPKGLKDTFAACYKDLKASERTEWVRHTVRRGETVSLLARRYGVQASEIARINQLRSAHRISVGQTLTIPVPLAYADNRPAPTVSSSSSSASRSVPANGTKYTVRRGDSLWKLAKKHGTTTSAIRRANNMGSRSKLIAGATIIIPGMSSGSAATGNFWYTIRRGDTISRIARRFGVSIRQIMGANSLSDPDRISVGQRIRIPRGM